MGLGFVKEHVLGTIKILVVLVCLGHVMMWIVMPTRAYLDRWIVRVRAVAHTTYFGSLGENVLLYTFPVLFVATMACLYLHLRNKFKKDSDDNTKRSKVLKKSWVDSWRRPALVRGLLGIVSWIELLFFAMFLALLVWFFYSFNNYWSQYAVLYASSKGIKVWQEKCYIVAYVLGLVGNVCMVFLFFPVTRLSSVLHVFGLTSESTIKYHIWVGHIAMILFTAHGVFYVFIWAATNKISEMLEWDRLYVSNVAGEISLLAGLAMWVTCLPRIRRRLFELFFYTHYLYIVFMVFYVFHVGLRYLCTSIAGFLLFLIDRWLRFLQSKQRARLVSARVLPCRAVELNFRRSPRLVYNPTSVLFLNVPGVSRLQWHPFTVSSSCGLDSEVVSVVVKEEGAWSGRLVEMFLSGPERVEVALEGPYGPSSTDYLRHDAVVMVSGGSGITSFISIIRHLLFTASKNPNAKTPKILLISAFKHSQDITMLDLILPHSPPPQTSLNPSNLKLHIEAYVTRDKDPITPDPTKSLTTTLTFKPNPLDSPLSPVLGQNGWLWLGGAIASSFVLFLLLAGVFTRFYIYPIDHNTDEIYSNVARSAFYMIFMCAAIGLASSAVFLWNKKRNGEDMTKVETSETCDGDKELESFPRQSLAQATSVSYGTRPNLKKMLLEIEESSVLVLASGPRKLRQDVAEICSSGLAKNLHFESISFSW